MFDGNGYLHPRHMGLATQADIILNKPTIGVAKSYLKIENNEFIMPDIQKNSYTKMIIKNEIYGVVLRSQTNVKPIFLSIGKNIDLKIAMNIVKELIGKESRIPIRLADIEANRLRREIVKSE